MNKQKKEKMLDEIASKYNYSDRYSLLRDYGIAPTVRVPRHKKWELILLIAKYLKDSN